MKSSNKQLQINSQTYMYESFLDIRTGKTLRLGVCVTGIQHFSKIIDGCAYSHCIKEKNCLGKWHCFTTNFFACARVFSHLSRVTPTLVLTPKEEMNDYLLNLLLKNGAGLSAVIYTLSAKVKRLVRNPRIQGLGHISQFWGKKDSFDISRHSGKSSTTSLRSEDRSMQVSLSNCPPPPVGHVFDLCPKHSHIITKSMAGLHTVESQSLSPEMLWSHGSVRNSSKVERQELESRWCNHVCWI